jgi:hypothetical protein
MKSEEIIFDENFEMYISIPEQSMEVCLILSDSLIAIDEDLSEEYRTKITNFINKSKEWYIQVRNYISEWAKKEYNINSVDKSILINIHVLFEQSEEELFGLEYGVDFDTEHGCGLKINGNNYDIIEIGGADVAFC